MAHEHNDFSIFVGDLAFEVDDAMLEQQFRMYYPTVKQAKVMIDPVSGRSRGYGFVRFTSEAERDRAMTEMNGVFVGSKQIRCSPATKKSQQPQDPARAGYQGPSGSVGGSSLASSTTATDKAGSDPNPANTTLFVGGLHSSVSEAELHAAFSRCGEITYVKIPPNKGCGFVQFVTRQAAEYAREAMNGFMLGGMAIRVDWGKSSKPAGAHEGPRPQHHAPAHHAQAPYPGYYGPGYDPYAYGAYGYGADPYAYGAYAADPYAAYGAYGAPVAPAQAAAAAAAGAAQATSHVGAPVGTAPAVVQTVLYDPMAPMNVDKMNMAYMHRHIPILTGAYVRVPIAMAPQMVQQQQQQQQQMKR